MRLLTPLVTAGGLVALATAAWAASPVPEADQAFLNKALQGNLAEVQLGKLATRQAASPSVKGFGEHMVQDHSRGAQKTQALAKQLGVTLDKTLPAEVQETEARLSKLSGKAFDTAYMEEMVQDHHKDVAEFEQATHEATQPAVKKYAVQTLPMLKAHLAMAQKVQAEPGKAGAPMHH